MIIRILQLRIGNWELASASGSFSILISPFSILKNWDLSIENWLPHLDNSPFSILNFEITPSG